jgi:hypothetical protein
VAVLENLRVDTGEAVISVSHGGSGPGVLLLHGFPQTRLMWRDIAPRLAQRFTVVCADLRGYGDSSTPPSNADHAPYAKRAMARDMIGVMAQLDFGHFSVAVTTVAAAWPIARHSTTRTGWTRSRSSTCFRSTPSGTAPTTASRSASGHGRCSPSPNRFPNA